MTIEEEIRLEKQLAVLKDVALEYNGKTIDNIIKQMEARIKEFALEYAADIIKDMELGVKPEVLYDFIKDKWAGMKPKDLYDTIKDMWGKSEGNQQQLIINN